MQYKLFVLVHNIRSLHNVGSIFRTAEFLGVDKIYLSGYTGCPPNEKIAKVSLGAENLISWEYKKTASGIISKLRREYPNIQIVGLENNLNLPDKKISPLPVFKRKACILLILGEEVGGISKTLLKKCDAFIEIPRFGKKESLNVSVAFGIAIFSLVSGKI